MKNFSRIFELSNISPEENSEIVKDFEKIVKWVEKLKKIDSEDIEPPVVFSSIMKLREDNSRKFDYLEGILKNIPVREKDFFVVPRVVKNE